MENWRVLLAESHSELRQEMTKALSEVPGLSLVAKVANGWDVMFATSQLKPDIILLDFDLSGLNGVEVTGMVRRGLPETRVIMLLDRMDEECIKAVEQCGACAYLLKDHFAQELPALLSKLRETRKESG